MRKFKILGIFALLVCIAAGFQTTSAAAPKDKIKSDKTHSHKAALPTFVPGELLVKFKPTVEKSKKDKIHAEIDAEILSSIPELGVERIKSRRGESTETLLKKYKQRAEIEYAEPNGIVRSHATPNDPRFSEQDALHNTGQNGGTADADIDAPEAWNLQTGSGGVVVASIDSGVDYNHPDLAANIWSNPAEIPGNAIDDDNNGYIDDTRGWNFVGRSNDPMDDHGHGSHTAGSIAAVGNNGIGVSGVSWQARIIPLKILDNTGSGTFSNAAQAIIYAANMGARVANNSWGCNSAEGACESLTIENAIKLAQQKNMLTVFAAGNENSNNDVHHSYPCDTPVSNVLCIGATDHNDQRAIYSSGGSNYGLRSVDLAAPGKAILSTVPSGTCAYCDPSGYRILSGSSMATALVSGGAALMLSQFPALSAEALKNLLMSSGDALPSLAGISVSGRRLNVFNALTNTFAASASPEAQAVLAGASTSYNLSFSALNGFSGPLSLAFSTSSPDISGIFSANPVLLSGSATATLTVNSAASMTRGYYALEVTVSDGLGHSQSIPLTLRILQPDFALSVSPSSRELTPGGSTSYVVNIRSIDRYQSPLSLTLTAASGLSAQFLGNPLAPPPDDYMITTMTLSANAVLALGDYPLSIQASDGVLTHSASAQASVVSSPRIPAALWSALYNSPNNGFEKNSKIISDADGNSYITAASCRDLNAIDESCASGDYDFVTIKYDSSGTPLWINSYNYGSGDTPVAIGLDSSNNVYVTGTSCGGSACPAAGLDFATVVYTQTGALLRSLRYDSGDEDEAKTALVSGSGEVYISGTRLGGAGLQIETVKYDNLGVQQWQASHDGGAAAYPVGMALTGSGALAVAAVASSSGVDNDYLTLKYDASGALTWSQRYDRGGSDRVTAIAADSLGNLYLSGSTGNGQNDDYSTLKYDPSGLLLWVQHEDGGDTDESAAFSSDSSANLYITGTSSNGWDYDYLTVKYDSSGNRLWSARSSQGRNDDFPADVRVDASGQVYVTGASTTDYIHSASRYDYYTVKYDSNGKALWSALYNYSGKDVATALTLNGAGHVTVTGASHNGLNVDIATVQYNDTLLPDLAISQISISGGNVSPGASVAVSDTVINLGGSASNPGSNSYSLSKNTVYDVSDIVLSESRNIPALAAAATDSALTNITVPLGTANGSYYLCAKTDSTGATSEAVESNNSRCSSVSFTVTRPDLTPTAISATIVSGSIVIKDQVKNLGNSSSGPFSIGFYLSADTVYQNSDSLICSRSLSDLAAATASPISGTLSSTCAIPAGVSAGAYYLIAFADPSNALSESNENNNQKTSASKINIGPDLLVTTLTVRTIGVALEIKDAVKNQGTAASGAFSIGFYLSSDNVYQSSDSLVCSRSLSDLTAVTSNPVSGSAISTCAIPAGTATGAYYLIALADATQLVAESIETNNSKASTKVNIGPDLLVTTLTTRNLGTGLEIKDSVKNQGTAAADAFTVSYYLSADGVYQSTDTLLCIRNVASLNYGVLSPASGTDLKICAVPSGVSTGRYNIIAVADSANQVAESLENNNNKAAISKVNIGPELLPTALSIARAGSSLNVTNAVSNQGSANSGGFAVRFYLSADKLFQGSDVLLCQRAISDLAPGSLDSVISSCSIPTIAAGSYWVIMASDADNNVLESNEANNSRVSGSTVSIP